MKFDKILLILSLAIPAAAQPPAEWTLEQCMEYAVANSPAVNTSLARSQIDRYDYRETVASLFPSISASTSGQFGFGRNLGEDNVYADVNSFSNSYGLSGSMTVFDGLASVYKVRMGKRAKLMGRHDLQKVKDNLAFEVMEIFFLVQGYSEMVELCRQQVEESLRNLNQTEQMAEVGLKGLPDVAGMKAQLAAARYALTKQENLLTINLIRLKEKMNLPLDEDIVIIPYGGEAALAPAEESTVEIFSFAKQTNPGVLSARLQEQYSFYNNKAAKGGMYPSIYINGGYSTGFYKVLGLPYEPFWDQLRNKRGHYLGFGVSIPIFTGLSRSTSVKRSALNYRIARNDAEIALKTLYSEIEQAIADVAGQADQYRQSVLRAEASEVSYRLSLGKYNEGMISAVELYTSSNRLLESRADVTQSLLMYHLKRRLLDYYKGIPFYTETGFGY